MRILKSLILIMFSIGTLAFLCSCGDGVKAKALASDGLLVSPARALTPEEFNNIVEPCRDTIDLTNKAEPACFTFFIDTTDGIPGADGSDPNMPAYDAQEILDLAKIYFSDPAVQDRDIIVIMAHMSESLVLHNGLNNDQDIFDIYIVDANKY